ncbi:MAG: hypothetical protein ACYS5V_01330, partial [Planctomycetota bacterium]
AGGANVNGTGQDRFAIGKRNYTVLKKILWRNEMLIDAEDVGGRVARTMYLDIGTGRTWLNVAGEVRDLQRPPVAARHRGPGGPEGNDGRPTHTEA